MSSAVTLASIVRDRKDAAQLTPAVVTGPSPSPASSLILLHTRPLTVAELKCLRSHFPIVIEYDQDIHSHATPFTLVTPPSIFDVLTLPIYKPEALAWYSANRTLIDTGVVVGNLHTVLVRRAGEDKMKLNAYNAESMIKEIPTDAIDKPEMVRKLLAKYVPAVAKCGFKLLWSLLKSKF